MKASRGTHSQEHLKYQENCDQSGETFRTLGMDCVVQRIENSYENALNSQKSKPRKCTWILIKITCSM
jgi:hypothetical protein